jgi:hypothetical protein
MIKKRVPDLLDHESKSGLKFLYLDLRLCTNKLWLEFLEDYKCNPKTPYQLGAIRFSNGTKDGLFNKGTFNSGNNVSEYRSN